MKTFDQYQQWVEEGIIPTHNNATYMCLGLAGEAGEVSNSFKRVAFDGNSTVEAREHVIDEMGDVLWYLAGLAITVGTTLEDVAKFNVKKLNARHGKKVNTNG